MESEMDRAYGPDAAHAEWKHGRAGTYSAGCRCDPCRAANTARVRRYRSGERRQPAATRRIELAARRVVDVILDDRDGWSIFGSEMNDEAQEAVAELAGALNRTSRLAIADPTPQGRP